jgi:hypothetical protein
MITNYYKTLMLELGDEPAEPYFPVIKDNPHRCGVKDDRSMQTACAKYEKASHSNRCMWLQFGWICTWREI